MSDHQPFHEIAEHLRKEGLSEDEISQVVRRLHEYDQDTQIDSVMDSIASGHIDLAKIVDEALGRDKS